MKRNHLKVPTIIFLTLGVILFIISFYLKLSIKDLLTPKQDSQENGMYLAGLLVLVFIFLIGIWGIFFVGSLICYIAIFIFNLRAYIKSEEKESHFVIQYTAAIILFALSIVLTSVDFSTWF